MPHSLNNPRISLVVADDHPIVRSGLRQAIERDPGLEVVAEAADGRAALAKILELKPKIAVLDLDMPVLDGLGVAREVHKQRLTATTCSLFSRTAPATSGWPRSVAA